MLNLTAPTGRAKEALDELGYSAFDNEGNFKGLETVLFDLQAATKDMDTEQRNMYLSMIGGKEHVKTLNALMNGLDDSYDSLKTSINEADGALNEVAETMMENNKGGLVELGSALEELALKIYDVIAPAIENLISFIKGVVDWLNNLSPEMQRTIVMLAGLAAAVGPVLIVVGKMSLGLSALIKLFAPMTTGLVTATGATGGLSAAIAFITGPIGIAIAAIAAITAVIVILWKTNEDFRDKMEEVWENIKGIIDGVITIIKGIIEAFIGLITGDFTKFADGLVKIWEGMWNTIKNVVAGAWNLLSGVFGALLGNIKSWFTGLASSAYNWGKNMISGFIDGIKSMAKKVTDAVSGVVGKAKDFMGFGSPTKEGEGRHIIEWGENMVMGFIDGIHNAKPELEKVMESVIPSMNATSTVINKNVGSVDHSGVIRVEGVNNQGELIGVVDMVMDALRREVRT